MRERESWFRNCKQVQLNLVFKLKVANKFERKKEGGEKKKEGKMNEKDKLMF